MRKQKNLEYMPDINELLVDKQLEAIEIDMSDLNEAIIRAPGDIAYWNQIYTDAQRKYLLAKQDYGIVRAKAWMKIREEGKSKTGKALTVDDLKALVEIDEEVQEVSLALIEAEADKEKKKKFAEAVVAKKDMIQSLGAKLREEMRSDFSIRETD
jgi:hypothetical protein